MLHKLCRLLTLLLLAPGPYIPVLPFISLQFQCIWFLLKYLVAGGLWVLFGSGGIPVKLHCIQSYNMFLDRLYLDFVNEPLSGVPVKKIQPVATSANYDHRSILLLPLTLIMLIWCWCWSDADATDTLLLEWYSVSYKFSPQSWWEGTMWEQTPLSHSRWSVLRWSAQFEDAGG